MTAPPDVKVPRRVDIDSREYWEGIDRGELRLQRCEDCGTYRWPFRCICNRCHSWNTVVLPSSGRGSIFSWAINRHAFAPGFGERLPYVSVLVRLDEQDDLIIPGVLDELEPEWLEIGVRVEAYFGAGTDDIAWRVSDGRAT